MSKKLKQVLFIAAMLLITGSSVWAAQITHSATISGLMSDTADQNLLIPKFDASLGTLNSVIISGSVSMQGYIGFENLKKFSGGNFNIDASNFKSYVIVYNASPLISLMVYTLFTGSQYTVSLGAYDGTTDYAGSSGTIVTGWNQSQDSDVKNIHSSVDPEFYSTFVGSGNLIFTVDTDDLLASVPNNNGIIFQAGAGICEVTGQACVTVVYDYTHTPEPATAALLCLASLVLRKRK